MRPPVSLSSWLRANLFSDPLSSATTLLFLGAILYWLPSLIDWALLSARFAADAQACEALEHTGACWGVVTEKYRFILFGRYPHAEQWRPMLATALLLMTIIASVRVWLAPRALVITWLVVIPVFLVLMGGGYF